MIFWSLYLAISLVSGFFGVTQLQYHQRFDPLRSLVYSFATFVINFVAWWATIPYAIWKGRFRFSVMHKVSADVPLKTDRDKRIKMKHGAMKFDDLKNL